MQRIPQPGHDLELQGEVLFFQRIEGAITRRFRFHLVTHDLQELSEREARVQIHGPAHREKAAHLRHEILRYTHCADEAGGRHGFLRFDEGVLYVISDDGQLLGEHDLDARYQSGHCVYGLAFDGPDAVWLAFPTGSTVSKFSLSERREVFRMGDFSYDEPEGDLSYPEDLCAFGGAIYVANMGSGHLVEIDAATLTHRVTRSGMGDLWEYKRNARFEVFRVAEEIFFAAV